MFSKAFWRAAGERAGKTFGQAGVTYVGGVILTPLDFDVRQLLISLALGTALSVFTSMASGAKDGNPSAINAEIVVPQ